VKVRVTIEAKGAAVDALYRQAQGDELQCKVLDACEDMVKHKGDCIEVAIEVLTEDSE
jgi:hypothetical protein